MFIPQDLENTIVIYHGRNDTLVLEKSVKKLVWLLRQRNCRPRLLQIENADHNSVFSDFDNLSNVMRSLLRHVDDWKSEVIGKGPVSENRNTVKVRSMPPLSQHRLKNQQSSFKSRSEDRKHKSRSMPSGKASGKRDGM